jgi:hypothetical protein
MMPLCPAVRPEGRRYDILSYERLGRRMMTANGERPRHSDAQKLI